MEKYILEKYSFETYSLENIVGKIQFGKYSLEKYTLKINLKAVGDSFHKIFHVRGLRTLCNGPEWKSESVTDTNLMLGHFLSVTPRVGSKHNFSGYDCCE